MDKYKEVETKTRKQIMIDNFIGGIFWGLGATIGVSLVITILGFIATRVNFIPFIGTFVAEILNYVLKTGHK